MSLSKNLRIAIIGLGALALGFVAFYLVAANVRPSDSLIKGLVEKQMEKRLKGGSIVSMTIIRGQSFPLQAHYSKVPYSTTLYPVVVNLTYNIKQKDGSLSENKDLTRNLYFYRSPDHKWAVDDDLH